MKYDPHTYAMTVQKIQTDGADYFESTIKEFPDIAGYGETFNEAYELAIDAIETSAALLEESGAEIPGPITKVESFSGRVTLRMSKNLHATTSAYAEADGVSLNSYITTALAEKVGATSIMTLYQYKIDAQLRELKTGTSRPNSVMLIETPMTEKVTALSAPHTHIM